MNTIDCSPIGRNRLSSLSKLAELCEVMEVHPLTLLTLAYAGDNLQQADQLLAQVRQELETVAKRSDRP